MPLFFPFYLCFVKLFGLEKKVAIRDNSLSRDKSLSLTSPEGVGVTGVAREPAARARVARWLLIPQHTEQGRVRHTDEEKLGVMELIECRLGSIQVAQRSQ
jgi:hypothetical protein